MRLRSQDSVQNYQRPPSPQRPLNKNLRPAGNEQEQSSSAEMYNAGPQVKSAPGTSLSPENQYLVEKGFASHGSPESSTKVNP